VRHGTARSTPGTSTTGPAAAPCYRRSPEGDPRGYTVAEQAAWVEEECADLKFAADKATVVREAAQDRLRVLLAQAEIVRSLGASVKQAYELAGTAG
jgi:hypothetical protein